MEEILRVLAELCQAGPTLGELERAKARLRWQMQELFDMPTELAGFVGQAVLSGTPATPEARIEQLLAVSADRLRQAARRIFGAQQSSLVVVGKLTRAAQRELQRLQRRLGA
jgi:predicted Zn-dependent peptidase